MCYRDWSAIRYTLRREIFKTFKDKKISFRLGNLSMSKFDFVGCNLFV